MITSSAPGKIILFGEHAVVYGQPALAVPVTQVHADVRIEEIFGPGVWINAPNIQLHSRLDALASSHPLAATVNNALSALGVSYLSDISILIRSTIPVASGLGSGAAVSVALIRALAHYVGKPLTDEQVSALAFETEKLYHGTPSGIDNTVVTFARPVYFVKGQPPQTFQVGRPFTIVIGDTGIAASTKETVGDVRRLWQENPGRFETYFDAIGSIVRTARQVIEAGFPDNLGPLMEENHALLRQMSVSSPQLERLVAAARAAGALGAKLSGGGRGGNMIALVRPEIAEAVIGSLKEAGAKQVIHTQVGA
ncbi:MAG: mevalonate kinase [Anaerolineales bacterium]